MTTTVGDKERRVPLWRQAEERDAQRAARRRRLRVVYDIDGPRVRLGILWFLSTMGALALGTGALALLYGAVAGVAGLQTAREWRRAGERPHRLVAGGGAALLPLAAAIDTALLGMVLLVLAAAAVGVAVLDRSRAADPVRDAGFTLQASMFVGLAAASPVLAYRYERGAAIVLVLLVASYEIGDYLIGSGGGNVLEGPTAGATAILVATFIVAILRVEPFEGDSALLFGGLAIVLCPLGQLAGSAILPDAAAAAPALRRLDSLLLFGPVLAFGAGLLAA